MELHLDKETWEKFTQMKGGIEETRGLLNVFAESVFDNKFLLYLASSA